MEERLTFEIDPTNWVTGNPDIAKKAIGDVTDLCRQARQDRQTLEDAWIEGYNIWDCHPQVRYYEGRANLYLPAGNRVIERAMGKIMARLFPSGDDFFDCKPLPPSQEGEEEVREDLDAAKALMFYDLHEAIKIRRKMPMWLRQLLVTGTSPWATDYLTAEDVRGRASRPQGVLMRRPKADGGGTEVQVRPRSKIGPTGRPVDLFTFYVWPPTVDELTEAVIVFEDQLLTKQVMLEWRSMGRYEFTDEELRANEGQVPEQSIWRLSDRLKRRGASQEATSGEGLYVVTTAYMDWARGGEEGAEQVACQFALLNDSVCLMAKQNPWWDQEPNYDWLRMGRYVDEAYGRGLIYWVRELQYQLNDTANLTLDTMTYSMMPPAAVDPATGVDPSLLLWRPGAFWPVPPGAIKWHVIPDTHRQGFDTIRQLYELIQESAGAATGGQYLPTLGVARGAETATGQELLLAQADIDIKLITDAIEEEGMEPLLHRLDSREQQFLPLHQERILRALGPKGIPLLREGMRIRREQMAGTRTYTWTGSHISEQREAMQKAGPALLKMGTEMAKLPDGKIDLLGMFQDLYRSYGFANAETRVQKRQAKIGFDPQLEHMVMRAGHAVSPMLGEPHPQHLAAHNAALPQAITEGWGDRLKQHMLETILMLREELAFSGQAAQLPQMAPGGVPGGNGTQAQPIFAAGGAR